MADLLALRIGDVFVPAETCVRVCNVLWYIDSSVLAGQGGIIDEAIGDEIV